MTDHALGEQALDHLAGQRGLGLGAGRPQVHPAEAPLREQPPEHRFGGAREVEPTPGDQHVQVRRSPAEAGGEVRGLPGRALERRRARGRQVGPRREGTAR